jgi:MmyB-like transcription regulator ligand binding domain
VLDAMTGAPAYLRNGRADILAANSLGPSTPKCSPDRSGQSTPPDSSSWTPARDFFLDWDRVANDVVATLRAEAGHNPYDHDLSDLVGQLSTQSETFRTRWAAHNVRFHDTGVKRFRHSAVGELTLTYETMKLSADTGVTIAVYTAEAGSRSEEALTLLASWTATLDQMDPSLATNQA